METGDYLPKICGATRCFSKASRGCANQGFEENVNNVLNFNVAANKSSTSFHRIPMSCSETADSDMTLKVRFCSSSSHFILGNLTEYSNKISTISLVQTITIFVQGVATLTWDMRLNCPHA